MDLHTDIEHLAMLLGTWRGKGSGHYPTIEDFDYFEEATFGHVGKPFMSYVQKSRDAVTELPLHSEAGYFRPVGVKAVELVLAQPSGIVEIHGGVVDGTTIRLESTTVLTTPTAKDVTSVHRTITVKESTLSYDVHMAAVGLPLQHHLSAELHRQ